MKFQKIINSNIHDLLTVEAWLLSMWWNFVPRGIIGSEIAKNELT